MRTRLFYGAAAIVAAVLAIAGNVGMAHPTPAPNIEVWWAAPLYDGGIRCIYMRDNDNGKVRRICPESGEDCWVDTGWQNIQPPSTGGMTSYFDSNGNLYVTVGSDQGGTFSGSTIGTCLGFSGNSSNTVMLPAYLVR